MSLLARRQDLRPISREAQQRVRFDFGRVRDIKPHNLLVRFGFGVAASLVSFAIVSRELVTRTAVITAGLAALGAWLLTGVALYCVAARAVRPRR